MSTTTNKKWNKFDTAWVLNLFGTAVGAGVLFLPINAGMGGFWPLVVMALLVGPMTYFAHRGLAYFVLSSSKPGSDITEVVEEHFGPTAGKLITLLYFFAIFPILLIYGNGITNTVDSFIVNQLGMASPNRVILSFVLIAILISVMLFSEKVREMEEGFGFNAATEKYVNMVEAGIIDPAKVTRSAIQNAASVSALILTTEVLVATKKEAKEPEMGNPGMMPGMM